MNMSYKLNFHSVRFRGNQRCLPWPHFDCGSRRAVYVQFTQSVLKPYCSGKALSAKYTAGAVSSGMQRTMDAERNGEHVGM